MSSVSEQKNDVDDKREHGPSGTVWLVTRVLTLMTGMKISCPMGAFDTDQAAKRRAEEMSRQLHAFSKSTAFVPGQGQVPLFGIIGQLGIAGVETQIVSMELTGMLLRPTPQLILPG